MLFKKLKFYYLSRIFLSRASIFLFECESVAVRHTATLDIFLESLPWFTWFKQPSHKQLYPPLLLCCCCLVAKSCPTVCNPLDCSLPASSVHGISQAWILEWVAVPFSGGSSPPRGWTPVSCIGRWVLYLWGTRKAPVALISLMKMPGHGKGQIMPQYSYENSLDFMNHRKGLWGLLWSVEPTLSITAPSSRAASLAPHLAVS